MPQNELYTAETTPAVKQRVTILKEHGLKGRARTKNDSLQAILDDAHTNEDLCRVKRQLKYYISIVKKHWSGE